MVSSRLFEMLADAYAKPSQPFRDTEAALGAANDVVGTAGKFQKEQRLGTKISDVLGDPTYGDLRLRDLEGEGSPLLKLLKLKNEMGPEQIYAPNDLENPTGLTSLGSVKKGSKVVMPSQVNLYRGKEFDHKVNEDEVKHAQDALTQAEKDASASAPAGVVIDAVTNARATAQAKAARRRLVSLGHSEYAEPVAATNPPAPDLSKQGGQPAPAPAPGAPKDPVGDFLKKTNAKDTPRNRAWAQGQLGQ